MNIRPLVLFKSNSDLAKYHQRHGGMVNPGDVRKRVPIAVIDDENFAPESNLISHGYNITQIGDIKRIEEIKDYSIVLCDIMGVGQHFDKNAQGAGIITEIRSHYPSIIVVAYTGSSLGSTAARNARMHADLTIKKDADISEWRTELDELVRKAIDPHYAWLRTRQRLADLEVDTKVILELEDAFVRAVLNGDEKARPLLKLLPSANLAHDARGVIQGLIASTLFALIAGA